VASTTAAATGASRDRAPRRASDPFGPARANLAAPRCARPARGAGELESSATRISSSTSRSSRAAGAHNEFDIVAGYRQPRRDPGPARWPVWGWCAGSSAAVRDIDCAFKVFHRRVLEAIPIASVGACVNTEILVRASQAGFRIHQVAVRHRRRRAGRQTGARPRVILRALVELAALYVELRPALPSGAAARESAS
jgi:hypothetical protein